MVKIKLNNGGYNNANILKDIDVNIKRSKLTAIAGPNGSGKTTLLRYLIKELKTNNKNIIVDGKDINDYSQPELAKKVSLLGQYSTLNQNYTVYETVAFGRYCHRDIKYSEKTINEALKRVGISHLAEKAVTEISGGEFQLVMLARILCQNTDIIILDEPSNNLDPKHLLMLMDILKEETTKGKTVIAVLHDLNTILNYSDNIILMKDGKVLFHGETEKIMNQENIRKTFDINCEITLSHDRKLSAFCYSL